MCPEGLLLCKGFRPVLAWLALLAAAYATVLAQMSLNCSIPSDSLFEPSCLNQCRARYFSQTQNDGTLKCTCMFLVYQIVGGQGFYQNNQNSSRQGKFRLLLKHIIKIALIVKAPLRLTV